MREVSTLISAQQRSAIETAEEVLERCRSGETIGLVVVEIQPDRKYTTSRSGHPDKHAVAGMLLECSMRVLRSGVE